MTAKSLLESNPYLRDPEQREQLLRRSVITSTAIEGISVSMLESYLDASDEGRSPTPPENLSD